MSSFHDKFYIASMGMNTKVQGRLPLLQCITFHSLLVFEDFVVRKIYLVKHQKSMTHISFEFTRIREGIGSTHRGILGTYTTNFSVRIYQLESRACLAKADDRIYQRHYVSGEELKDLRIGRNCQIIIHKRIWLTTKNLMWVTMLNQKEK